jgi:hypothetical protein
MIQLCGLHFYVLQLFLYSKSIDMHVSSQGFSALEAIVAIAISGIVVLGSSQLIINSFKSEARTEKTFWLGARRAEFQNFIRSDAGWDAILGANPNLKNCLSAVTGCGAYASAQNLVLPIDGNTLDGANPSTGMTSKGDFCTTFNATTGNANCPIGISLKWQVLCDDAACLHGQPRIIVDFQSKEGDGSSENLSSYRLVSYHDPKMETLNEVCTSMKGTLTGQSCDLPQLSKSCDPSAGSFVVGFDPDGGVLCGTPNPGKCAGGDAATGFDANGGLVCATACP